MTEPKLLIKILHVTFTGGPVKWNESDMTGESLKPDVSARIAGIDMEGGFGENWGCWEIKKNKIKEAASTCIQRCVNTTSSECRLNGDNVCKVFLHSG